MSAVTLQFSLYPLGRDDLSPVIDDAVETFRAAGLSVEPGTMSSVVAGEDAAVFTALGEAYRRAAGKDRVVMVATLSNACPSPADRG